MTFFLLYRLSPHEYFIFWVSQMTLLFTSFFSPQSGTGVIFHPVCIIIFFYLLSKINIFLFAFAGSSLNTILSSISLPTVLFSRT